MHGAIMDRRKKGSTAGQASTLGLGRIKRAITVLRRRSGEPQQPSESTHVTYVALKIAGGDFEDGVAAFLFGAGRLKTASTSSCLIRFAGSPRSPRFCSSVPSPIFPRWIMGRGSSASFLTFIGSGLSVMGESFVLAGSGSLPQRSAIIQYEPDGERQSRNLLKPSPWVVASNVMQMVIQGENKSPENQPPENQPPEDDDVPF